MVIRQEFLVDRKQLTFAASRAAMDAAIGEAEKLKLQVTVAIVDAGGHVLNLARMDCAQLGTVKVALAKARSSVLFKRPTKAFADRYAKGETVYGALPGAMPFGGGIPIIFEDELVGAIAASGASSEQDVVIAAAGLQAILPD